LVLINGSVCMLFQRQSQNNQFTDGTHYLMKIVCQIILLCAISIYSQSVFIHIVICNIEQLCSVCSMKCVEHLGSYFILI
jgi:hypothetical protein